MRKLLNSFTTTVLVSVTFLSAQTPANDPNWIHNPTGSEEFSGTNSPLFTLPLGNFQFTNQVFWKQNAFCDPQYPTGNGTNGALHLQFTANSLNNLPKDAQELGAWAEMNGTWWDWNTNHKNDSPPPDPYYGWGGGLVCSDQTFPYLWGYYELRFRMPYYVSPTSGNATQLGLIPQFWMSKQCDCGNGSSGPCPLVNYYIKDEVDIMEGAGFDNKDFEIHTHWFYPISQCPTGAIKREAIQDSIYFQPPTYQATDFIKLGFERMPTYYKFYVNDVLYLTQTNAAHITTNTMTVWLDLATTTPATTWYYPLDVIEPNATFYPNPDPNNTMDFIVDYFRYYELDTDHCEDDVNVLSLSDLNSIPNSVFYNINVGVNGTEVINTSNNLNKTIRHSGAFTVICDFEVPLGSELTVLPTPCH